VDDSDGVLLEPWVHAGDDVVDVERVPWIETCDQPAT